jgi:hypothetical protein
MTHAPIFWFPIDFLNHFTVVSATTAPSVEQASTEAATSLFSGCDIEQVNLSEAAALEGTRLQLLALLEAIGKRATESSQAFL